mgnify:CR=1 FL=1
MNWKDSEKLVAWDETGSVSHIWENHVERNPETDELELSTPTLAEREYGHALFDASEVPKEPVTELAVDDPDNPQTVEII